MVDDRRVAEPINVGGDNLIEIRDAIVKLGVEIKGKLRPGWQENVQHLAGDLITSTKGAMQAVSGGVYTENTLGGSNLGTVTVANRIFPAANRLLARTLGMINGFQVSPGTSDEMDKDASKGAEKLSLAQWYSDRIFDEVSQALLWAFSCSHGFILEEGDATLDEPEMVFSDEEDKEIEMPTGRVVRQIVIPTDLNTLPGIKKLDDTPVLHVRVPMFREEILRRWGGEKGIGDKKLGEVLDKAPRFTHSMDALNTLDRMTESGQIRVDRLWWKPDRKAGWPKGKMAVLVGDTVIWEDKEWIGVGDKEKPRSCIYPVVDFSDVPVNVGYWGRGRQSVARAPQKILNVAWTKASQVAALPGLMMAIPIGSQISNEKITNAPVSIIKYNTAGGRGVDWYSPPRMDLYEWVIEKCSQWIDEAFSQPPPSRGVSPGSRFPASGLQTLIEQAELSDTPFGRLTIDAISRLMRLNLLEGQRVWPDEMVDYVLGDSGRHERAAFKKANLADGWDLRVLPDTGLPQSRSARLDQITKLAQFGLLGDMEDPKESKKARKLARIWTEDEAYDPDKQDEANAKDEELRFQTGEALPIREWDDDVVHIQYHLDRAKERARLEYTNDPQVYETYKTEEEARMAHLMEHMTRAQPPQPEPAPGQEMVEPEGLPPEVAEAPIPGELPV